MCNSTSAQCMSYPGGGEVKSIALGRFSILEPRKRDFVRFKKKLIFSCSFGNLTGFDNLAAQSALLGNNQFRWC